MNQAIITDVEGTTTDIRFVQQILFPYSYQRLPAFIEQHQQQATIQTILADLRQEINQPQASLAQLISTLLQWIEQDSKSPILKNLQGLIWREGYLQQAFTGHLYDDVLPVLQRWHRQGFALYVYSSGSIASQQLLFSHCQFGDISHLFTGYFDTQVGPKKATTSYQNIAQQIGLPATQLHFLSDVTQELAAAQAAGWHTYQLSRDSWDNNSQYQQVSSFDQLPL